jgi:hypothetical protein
VADAISRHELNLPAVQILLGHTRINITVRYLGVDVEDALELTERSEVRADPMPDVSRDLDAPRKRSLVHLLPGG